MLRHIVDALAKALQMALYTFTYYQYNPFKDEVDIRPSNEGGIFSYYSSILEKLNEHSSSFAHTSIFSRSPIGKETYNSLLESTDWMIILDQNLKSWDISLQSESEKLFYKEDECRSIGIYSKNSRKFSLGYKKTICVRTRRIRYFWASVI